MGPPVLKKMANQSMEKSGPEHLDFFSLKLIGQSGALGSKACRQQVKVIRWDLKKKKKELYWIHISQFELLMLNAYKLD